MNTLQTRTRSPRHLTSILEHEVAGAFGVATSVIAAAASSDCSSRSVVWNYRCCSSAAGCSLCRLAACWGVSGGL